MLTLGMFKAGCFQRQERTEGGEKYRENRNNQGNEAYTRHFHLTSQIQSQTSIASSILSKYLYFNLIPVIGASFILLFLFSYTPNTIASNISVTIHNCKILYYINALKVCPFFKQLFSHPQM